VVEVELGPGRAAGRDQAHAEPTRRGELRHAATTLDLEVVGQCRHRRVEVADAQHDPLERAGIAGALGVEERQLAEARIGADEREVIGLLDDVHAEVRAGEVGDLVAVVDPEGDVVEGVRSDHGHGNFAYPVEPPLNRLGPRASRAGDPA
jgi:hypothetical protein